MATAARIKRIETEVKKLNGIRDMKGWILQNQPTPEHLDHYYQADDRLDEKLDELYSSSIMFWQIEKPHLADLYLKYTKEAAKQKLLRKFQKEKTDANHYQIALRRIETLEEELKKKKLPRPRIRYLNKTLSRLRSWTENQ